MLSFPSAARIMAEVDFVIRAVTIFVAETTQIQYNSRAPALWISRVYWVSTGFYGWLRLRSWLPQLDGRAPPPLPTNHLTRPPGSPTIVVTARPRPFRCAI
jgi:hypothetical protein